MSLKLLQLTICNKQKLQLECDPNYLARQLPAFECSVDERNLPSELEQFPFNRQTLLDTPHKIEA